MIEPFENPSEPENVVTLPGIGDVTKEELERLTGHEEIYEKTHKKPDKKTVTFGKSLGLENAAFVATAIGGMVWAAIRTGGIFLVAEERLLVSFNVQSPILGSILSVLPIVAMFSALFAVEGYLFAQGLLSGRSSGRITTSLWGLLFALGISIVAGVVSSLPIVQSQADLTTTVLYWVLVVISGPGATILAYFGAHNIGVLRNRWDGIVKQLDEQHEAAMAQWYKDMRSDYHRRGRRTIYGEDTPTGAPKQKAIATETAHVMSRVKDYLVELGISPNEVGIKSKGYSISPNDIAQHLGFTDSTSVRVALTRLRKG
jgi:hypothetical protein